MAEKGYKEVSPVDFYRALFPPQYLLHTDGDGKGNIIAHRLRTKKMLAENKNIRGKKSWTWIIRDDYLNLYHVMDDPFAIIAPCTYWGHERKNKRADGLFAFVVDIDGVTYQFFRNMIHQWECGIELMPSYIVNSGRGIHVYYFLKEPIELYHNRFGVLGEVRQALAEKLFGDNVSLDDKVDDHHNICQGFRVVGSLTKLGKDYPVRAFKISDNRYTIDELWKSTRSFGEKIDINKFFNYTKYPKLKKKGKLTLEQAKRRYPDWYQRRVVQGQTKNYEEGKRLWTCKRDLYDWYKRYVIEDKVKSGGRYWSIMGLCNIGLKCGISKDEIIQDAYSYCQILDRKTEDETNHFTDKDIESALRCLDNIDDPKNKTLLITTRRQFLEDKTNVEFPHNKRNYRKQAEHIKIMNAIRDIEHPDGEWRNKNGAPKKELIVQEWRRNHPDGWKIDCERDTGLSRHTVLKWWGEDTPKPKAKRKFTKSELLDCWKDEILSHKNRNWTDEQILIGLNLVVEKDLFTMSDLEKFFKRVGLTDTGKK